MISFDVITLFPEMFKGIFELGVIGRAREKGLIRIDVHDLRRFGEGRHKSVDDTQFGGGDGMVMMAEPIAKALEAVMNREREKAHVVLTTPQGKPLNRERVEKLSAVGRIVIVCGRYAGVDERVRELLVDEEISIGDYVLSGGELAAMVIIDAVSRYVPGVLGNEDSAANDSFPHLLEEAQYTRPRQWRGLAAPEILLSGDHAKIAKWRAMNRLERTKKRRPDLYRKALRRLKKLEEALPAKKKK